MVSFMMNFQYYVVEFLRSPHVSVPRFVCIPSSWIRSEPTPDANRTIAIAFPKEQFVATEGRILAGEPFHSDWLLHMVNIKCGYDNLNEGRKYAAEQCSVHAAQENDQSTPNVQFRKPEKAAKRATKRSVCEDAIFFNKGRKRPYVQVPNDFKSSHKDNSNHEKGREKIAREKEILERLSCAFEEMHEGFNIITDSFTSMYNIVDKMKTSCINTANLTNEFLNTAKKMHHSKETHDAKNTSERSQKSYKLPDDSDFSLKWTLRHWSFKAGLKELLPASKVYVRIAELEKLDTEANDPRTAARMLMKEIFSDNALSICTLAGLKRAGGSTTNKHYRPGLDKYSRIILMMYLKEYADKRGWEIVENQIWMSLRNRLLEFRKNARR